MNRTIRHSTTKDIPLILRMFDHSRQIMRNNGNTVQWPIGYPRPDMVEADIERNASYIIEDNGTPVGTFALIIGIEPTYQEIQGGQWLNALPYGTIHRIACMPETHGIADCCFEFCDTRINNLRVDTHERNLILQHILKKHGFQYCCIIHIADGTPRMAYQKTKIDSSCNSDSDTARFKK